MVAVLKDILLCLLGFRFIYMVYISWYYIQDISNVLLPPTCVSFDLPESPVWQYVSQTSMEDSSHKGNTGKLSNSRVLAALQVITFTMTQALVHPCM